LSHPINPELRIMDHDFYAADPHPAFTWMRANAPVYRDPNSGVWGVGLHEDIMTVSRDPLTFSSAGGIRPDAPAMPQMIDLDDPLHKKHRNLVNKGFTLRRVQDRETRIREISKNLVDAMIDRDQFEFVSELASWLPLIVIGDMLGVEPDRYADLLRWSDDLVKGAGATSDEAMNLAATAFGEYDEYQRKVIANRRASAPTDDLVSVLVHAEVDGERLTDDELVFELLLILIGGDETTRHVISGGLYELLRVPERYEAICKAPERLPSAIEEMLRWVTPIQNMARTATCDTELRGQKIAEGEKLLLLYPSANRDETMFDRPFEFDIARTPNDHIAFGFGAHFCLGASLARLELRCLFEELGRRMPDLRLASDALPPKRASNFISGIESLPVRRGG
jgi:cytochrome P450 family 142 subfamily A polypeptide 1